MKLKDDLKDWQIAREIFGKNTQTECRIIKNLRKKPLIVLEDYGEGCYHISHSMEETGWIMFSDILDI